MEILIVLLVFILPVVSVILDDRKKKNIPKVKSKRIVWPDDRPEQPAAGRMRPVAGAGIPGQAEVGKPAGTAVPAPDTAPGSGGRPDAVNAAGSRQVDAGTAAARYMGAARSTKSRASEEQNLQPEEKKTFTEKQKLIIYSEILKPKFDS